VGAALLGNFVVGALEGTNVEGA
jgi:hypothetical protein